MIFVTVGTHEQPFNRLVKYMDEWASRHNEKVIIQTGYSSYEPQSAEWKKMYPYQEMLQKVSEARIVITHGGPSSFIMPLQIGKTPIVVPRKCEFNEHVNNHQVHFCKEVEKRMGTIIVVEDENDLSKIIENYDQLKKIGTTSSNNIKFCDALKHIVDEMFEVKS